MLSGRFQSPAWVVPIILATMAAIFVIDVMTPIGVALPMLYVIAVYLAGWLPQRWALPAAGVSATMLALAGAWLSPPGGESWIVWTNRALSIITIWLAFGVSLIQHRLAVEVKHLHGLLPICASCKKIRDERGTWHSLETYLWEHSDAQLTHGLCPVCLEAYTAELQTRARS
jgi:hypothetical protein